MTIEENYCEFSGRFYTHVGICSKCRKKTAEHMKIEDKCKECYVKDNEKQLMVMGHLGRFAC